MPAVSRARLGAVASVLLIALLAASGCGVLDSNTASPGPSASSSTEATAGPTALPQTCQLLTADEVKSLTGLAVEDQSPSDEDGKRGCEWTLGLKHLVVELGVTSEPLFEDEAAQLATGKKVALKVIEKLSS